MRQWKRALTASLAVLLVGILTQQSAAQPARRGPLINPAFRADANLTFSQAVSAVAALGRTQPAPFFPVTQPAFAPVIAPSYPSAVLTTGYNPFGTPTATLTNESDFYGIPNSLGYGYPYGTYIPPTAGALFGTADLTRAQGRYLNDYQSARLLNQQVEQMKIETARKRLEYRRYLQSLQPNYDEIRDKELARSLDRARRHASDNDIFSARALNTLLDHFRQMHAKKQEGADVDIPADLLKNINVASASGGNIALIKQKGRLVWTDALNRDAFEKARKEFEEKTAEAIENIKANGRPDGTTMAALQKALNTLHVDLEKQIGVLTSDDYMESKRFLNQLNDAVQALKDPNVSNYFNNIYVARGKKVKELVDWMLSKGLRFAPAVPGDYEAYRTLHQLLVAYDAGSQIATRP